MIDHRVCRVDKTDDRVVHDSLQVACLLVTYMGHEMPQYRLNVVGLGYGVRLESLGKLQVVTTNDIASASMPYGKADGDDRQ